MHQTLLGSLALAYQPLWGENRALTGIRLAVFPVPGGIVDALHLLQVLRNFWPHKNSTLIISPSTPALLSTLLEHAPAYSPYIEVPSEWLEDAAIASLVQIAHLRGLPMVWRGPNDWVPAPDLVPCFRQQLLSMDAQDTLAALRSAQAQSSGNGNGNGSGSSGNHAPTPQPSPVQANQIYENIPSRALVDHCLDQRQAAALLGWPTEEVLHLYRHGGVQPSYRCLQRVINAASDDASMETIEALIGEDPVLAYRLLAHINSAAMGLRGGIDSLRRALMMLGYTALKAWCMQQLPNANEDHNLDPVRTGIVLRAHLIEHLLDAGGETDLRREIYLCGLFSQLDLVLGTKIDEALGRIPISSRITEAITSDEGPYAPYLLVAKALEAHSATHLPELCAGFEMDLDDVNRALLRTLGATAISGSV